MPSSVRIVIQWLPAVPPGALDPASYNPKDEFIYLGALLIVLMIFRPQGIIPRVAGAAGDPTSPRTASVPGSPGGPVRVPTSEALRLRTAELSLDAPGYIGPETE